VLNTAEGPWTEWGFVDLGPAHYAGSGIHYQGFTLWDSTGTNIAPYFGPAADYLELVLAAPGGKALVSCQMGVSRSSTLALAFLMIKRSM
jgi:protein-tyrosine phosphatase